LRNNRHEFFDEDFQEEIGTLYQDSRLGHPPVPPAKLALAAILQAYTGVSDEEAMEAMVMLLQNAGEIRASKKRRSC
jgi:transposase